jgi:hypothetical protein
MKPKNRMVSFRLSAEEYDRLRQAGSVIGVTNLSELARVAMNRMLESPKLEQVALSDQFRELRVKIQQLSSELERLSRTVTDAAD